MFQSKIPQKLKDSGSFTIPCSIGTRYNGRALCDLGVSINLMPLSVFKQLGVGVISAYFPYILLLISPSFSCFGLKYSSYFS